MKVVKDKHQKFLICGGAGFIGSNMVGRLLKEGHQVTVVDDLSTGSEKNLEPFIAHPAFDFVKADVCDYNDDQEYDRVVNLACPASPVHYQTNPIHTMLTNVQGTYNLLGFAYLKGARFLQASTSEVYGDPMVHPQTEEYWGNVNCYGPRACYTDDVEVLTDTGWKLFSDLKVTDTIATLNQNTDRLEYQLPTEIIEQEYDGVIQSYQNQNIDLSVTPNHKMYARKRNSDNFELIESQKFTDVDHSVMKKTVSDWNGPYQEFFFFPEENKNIKFSKHKILEKVKMDDWLEFMGYFLTEGCVYIHNKQKIVNGKTYFYREYRIQISQSETANNLIFTKIGNCLTRLGIKYSVSRSGNSYFVFNNKQIAIYLSKFGKSRDKYIPREFLNLSREQLKILFDSMMDGDGTKESEDHSRVYYSTSKHLVDGIQEIMLKLGYRGNIRYSKSRNIYSITCVENVIYSKYPIPFIEIYNGMVYCVTVPNRVIYVRRNGKAVFCGNCYDEGKRAAETLVYDFQRAVQLDCRIVRIFNTYGPNMAKNDGRVVSNFIVQALEGKPLSIYGDGSQTRSFCYVDDTVEAILSVLEGTYRKPLNVGNPVEFSVLELANAVLEALDKKDHPIQYYTLPQDDPRQRNPNIDKIKELYGWEPKVQLDQGLSKTVDYFMKLLDY
jgi:UDP-glucuronate decarboxylase